MSYCGATRKGPDLEAFMERLAARYPTVDGEPTVAYLWARTARDPQTTGRVPLLKTFWLCKKQKLKKQ